MNVLNTLGLISSSFGSGWGDGGQQVEVADKERFKYLRLCFRTISWSAPWRWG